MQEIFKNTLEIVRRSWWYLEVNILQICIQLHIAHYEM